MARKRPSRTLWERINVLADFEFWWIFELKNGCNFTSCNSVSFWPEESKVLPLHEHLPDGSFGPVLPWKP